MFYKMFIVKFSFEILLTLKILTFLTKRTKRINYYKNKESDKKSNILSVQRSWKVKKNFIFYTRNIILILKIRMVMSVSNSSKKIVMSARYF